MARQQEIPEQEEVFEIKLATRHAVPQLLAIYGPQFSGKTLSAIYVAAGLVEPGAKIGVIDTELGRFSMYADDPDVRRVVPQGMHVIELHAPFHPKRYIAAYRALEAAGCTLTITDSGTHAWAGDGGCLEMKERDKGWANAKLWNKKMLAHLTQSSMHQIVCLQAQEKTKIVGKGKDQEYIPLGIRPVSEKSFPFSLGLAFSCEGEVDGRSATHLATAMKWPKAMNFLFDNWKPQLLTPEIGRRIREWNNSAPTQDEAGQLQRRARLAAMEGTEGYRKFFDALTPAQRKMLAGFHAENKQAAVEADRDAAAARESQGEARRYDDPTEEAIARRLEDLDGLAKALGKPSDALEQVEALARQQDDPLAALAATQKAWNNELDAKAEKEK